MFISTIALSMLFLAVTLLSSVVFCFVQRGRVGVKRSEIKRILDMWR